MNKNFLQHQLSDNFFLVEAKPHTFYALVDIINDLDESFIEDVNNIIQEMSVASDILEEEAQQLRHSFNSLLEGVRQATKRQNPFDDLTADNDSLKDFAHSSGYNFVRLVLLVITDLQAAHHYLHDTAKNMQVEHITLFSKKLIAATFEDLQAFNIQYDMHHSGPLVRMALRAKACPVGGIARPLCYFPFQNFYAYSNILLCI
jgi:hypothetical protein